MTPKDTQRLSAGTRLAFGVGQTAEGIKNVAFAMFVVLYYNQVLGLDPGLAGLAAGIALGVDAISDPLAGALSDAFRSRWGRRHPFMAAAAVPLAVSFYFLFAPPPGLEDLGLFLWLVVMAILVRASMTFYHVPHLALGADLTDDYQERTKIFTYSTVFGYVGGIGMRTLAFPVFFPSSEGGLLNEEAYKPFAITLGLVMAATILVCVWGTRHRIPYLRQATQHERFSFGEMFKGLYGLMRFASFRALFFGMLVTTFIFGIEAFMYTYIGKFFWSLTEEQLGLIGASILVGLPIAFFVVPWMTRKLDKRNTLIVCAIVYMLAVNIPIIARLTGVFPPNDSPLFLPLLFAFRSISGVVSPALFIIPQSMFADIGDEVALATGKRIEGLIFSARSLIIKAVYGLGTVVGGTMLNLIEFPDKATPGAVNPDVLFRLGMVEGPLTSVFTLVGLAFYLGYRLDRKRHAEIRAELERNEGKSDLPLSSAQRTQSALEAGE